MNGFTMTIGVALAAGVALAGAYNKGPYEMYEGVYDEANLVEADQFRQVMTFPAGDVSRRWRAPYGTISVDNLILTYRPKNDGGIGFGVPVGYSTAASYEIRFAYRSSVPFRASVGFHSPRLGASAPGSGGSLNAPKADAWTVTNFVAKAGDGGEELSFSLGGFKAGSTFELKDLVIRGVEPEPGTDKSVRSPLTLDGKVCEAIYWTRSDLRGNWFDRKAAQILRFALLKAGGPLLPVREAKTDADYATCAVYVGKAGEKTGIIDPKKIAAFTEAGWAMTEKDGRLAIAGAYPSGQAFGVVEFLRRLGVRYYVFDSFTRPEKFASTAFEAAHNPAIPRRYLGLQNIYHQELLGYQPGEVHTYRKLGACDTISYHQGCAIVPERELLAMGLTNGLQMAKDGHRITKHVGGTIYCFSEPALDRLFIDRLSEIARCTPLMDTYSFQPGDGGDVCCYCEKCRKLRSISESDVFVAWVNRIAAGVAKNVPGSKFRYGAYVDFEKPPKEVGIADNVQPEYCPYTPREWLSHYWYDCPGNTDGRKVLESWGRLQPYKLALMTYPADLSFGGYNATPSFWFNYNLHKTAAEHHVIGVEYCGWHLPYGNGAAPGGSMAPLCVDVIGRVMDDPTVDVKKEIDRFIADYYGPAAREMHDYFDLMQARPMEIKWIQNCEERRRGFFEDEAFADQAWNLLVAAREKASADGKGFYRMRILWEMANFLQSWLSDNNRARGTVTKANFPKYAERLAEFCRVRKEMGWPYIGTDPVKWFWDNHLLRIEPGYCWYDGATLKRLAADPVKTLGATVPVSQQEEPDGWSWVARGMLGGEEVVENWRRKESTVARVARRPSSGSGIVRLVLHLEKPIAKPAKLVLHGIDNEKPDVALGEIVVNDKSLYRGAVKFTKEAWTDWAIEIPANLLVAGDNDIVIRNVTPDKEQDGLCGEAFFAVRNYWWGWFMFDKVSVRVEK